MDLLDLLFEKYRNNECSPEELEDLLSYFRNAQEEERLKAHIEEVLNRGVQKNPELETTTETVYSNLLAHIQKDQFTSKRRFLPLRWVAAASILILLGMGGYFALHRHQNVNQVAQIKPGTFKNDALPGNKAYLTLSNGQQLAVGSLPAGQINTHTSARMQKAANGAIVYAAATNTEAPLEYNTFTVPRGGGKHEIKLADGTLAVLDAESSIRFPVAFNGKERRVTITGQVYFEVVHKSYQKFYVTVGNQTIEDIGTHFNVNTFDGEIKTTLIEGSIKVNNIVLQPGQQAVENNGKITLNNQVDEEEVLAWKNDLFKFSNNTSLQTVMNQLSRWYDLDVQYVGNSKQYHFGGYVPRNSKLSEVCKILEYSGVRFSLDGKKITVYQ